MFHYFPPESLRRPSHLPPKRRGLNSHQPSSVAIEEIKHTHTHTHTQQSRGGVHARTLCTISFYLYSCPFLDFFGFFFYFHQVLPLPPAILLATVSLFLLFSRSLHPFYRDSVFFLRVFVFVHLIGGSPFHSSLLSPPSTVPPFPPPPPTPPRPPPLPQLF